MRFRAGAWAEPARAGSELKQIAVIGGGGTGHTLAADLSRRGFDVVLCEEPGHEEALADAVRLGGVAVGGALPAGFVPVRVEPDFDSAVRRADILFVAVVANRHEPLARRLANSLRRGQAVVIGPDNGGSLVFARAFRELGAEPDVLIGGMAGNYFACRLIGPASVFVGMPPAPKKIAAFPVRDTERLIGALDGLFDWVPATNVLEMALSTPNIPNHLAGAILNTGAVEFSEGRFNLFRDGLSPSVVRCIEAVASERNAVLAKLGYPEIHSPMLAKIARLDAYPELDMFRDLAGPASMTHRYVDEDAQAGITLLVSLGRALGVATPVTSGLLAIASAMNGVDYHGQGRRCETLGLVGPTIADINRFLDTGTSRTTAESNDGAA